MTPRLTSGARRALGRAGLARRRFLQQSGALIVAFGAARHAGLEPLLSAQGINGRSSTALDSWIAITPDSRVLAYTGKCELGQGLFTAQVQLVAEELDVALARVTLTMCDTAATPDQGTTSGAQSHPANFNHANLALACATARDALVGLAAERLAAPAAGLATADGTVFVKAEPTRRVAYGDLVGGRKFMLALDPAARRKNPAEWKLLGTSVPRLDLPAMVTAQLEYVHTVRVPGMLHGQVVRPPSVAATLAGVDEASVRGMPGFVRVVVRKNFVGVVAEKPFQAAQIAARLQVSWTPGPALPPQTTYYDQLRREAARDTYLLDSGDLDQALRGARTVVSATYRHPFHMHGSVGSSCAVADVQPGRATLWSATQAVFPMRETAAQLLGLPPDQVRVVFTRGSGCYGINGADTVTYDAALLSQAVGRPVRVQLTRRDEMAWENFGNAFVIDQRAGLDASGTIVAWDYEAWSPALGGRPGYDSPGNVVTGWLAGFAPAVSTARTPAPPPTTPLNNNLNTAPSYVTGCAGGACTGTGTVRSERVLSHRVVSPFFTGPLRAPERFQNTFAHESFMDEIAAAAKADPVAFRLKHLRDERLRTVVRQAASAARWETRTSPRAATSPTGMARGRGISCVLYEGNNGYVAIVAEVAVDQTTGVITVQHLVGAQDCGPISNPDGVKNQFEGGALHGMSRTLFEEVTWNRDAVTSADWRSYRTFAVGTRTPVVDTVLVSQPAAEANGAGETAITAVAAAIGNAVFDATGARLREIPFTPERVKAALASRGTA